MSRFISKSCQGVKCQHEKCIKEAAHKVEEVIFSDDPNQYRHPLTAYLCHPHFVSIMGQYANYA